MTRARSGRFQRENRVPLGWQSPVPLQLGLTVFVQSLGLKSHPTAVVFWELLFPLIHMMLQVKPSTLMGPCGGGELFGVLTGVLWMVFFHSATNQSFVLSAVSTGTQRIVPNLHPAFVHSQRSVFAKSFYPAVRPDD